MNAQLDLFQAKTNKDNAIEVSLLNADSHIENWSDTALEYLRMFLSFKRYEEFMAEDFRMWAESNGLPSPKNKRAFGGVIVRASKKGLIRHVKIGYTKNPKAHRTPASIWQKTTEDK